jgi:class 3 adenylate cyclase
MGDGLMAVFNAPMPQSNHAQRAAQAALRIQKSTAYYAAQFPAAKRLCFRIGVHTGEAIVGNVGGAELMNYTAVGDTVNVAKRLEENAQPGQVLVSQETFILIATMVKGRPLENLVVKGRTRPIKVFEIAGL